MYALGVCQDAGPADRCELAHAQRQFSPTAGQDGWTYGYWAAGLDPDGTYDSSADFQPLVYVASSRKWLRDIWEPFPSSNHRWTSIEPGWSHPHASPDERPVRRWTSSVQGPARIEYTFRKRDTSLELDADGTRVSLLVDGATVAEVTLRPGDGTGTTSTVEVDLVPGTRIEVMVDALENDLHDLTDTFLTITSR